MRVIEIMAKNTTIRGISKSCQKKKKPSPYPNSIHTLIQEARKIRTTF